MVLVRHNHPKSLGLKELSCIYIALTFPWMLKNSQLQLHITARRELSSLACVGTSNFNVFRQGLQSQGRSQLLRVEPLSWTGESRRKSDWESGIETVMSLSSSLQFSLTAFTQLQIQFCLFLLKKYFYAPCLYMDLYPILCFMGIAMFIANLGTTSRNFMGSPFSQGSRSPSQSASQQFLVQSLPMARIPEE